MPSEAVLEIARAIRTAFASDALSPLQAKLYSQRVRRDMGADGLASFNSSELAARLDEAMLLLETAWIEKSAGADDAWRQTIKRAAELLEWTSQPSLKPAFAPIHFLSAAAYQAAGYPAMALSHLQRMPESEPFSGMLREFLRGDFDGALGHVQAFWATQRRLEEEGRLATLVEGRDGMELVELELTTIRHVVMCIGTICAYLRTGESALVERALTKLDALARSYLHSRNSYSYLLARLSADAARNFVDASLWPHVARLADDASRRTRDALTQFARAAFVNRRALVWPGQRRGIERLAAGDSFVLCTPTGSGKTTIATLGAVQGLFAPRRSLEHENLVLYLVPSRALAAEVETRFAEDLRGIAAEPVVVTGLYGGADWGPTDAWVQVDQPTVVICTFEKADALLRYLGTLFLDRVRLVVIDEAHMVELNPDRADDVTNGTSRALRLEQLSARLLRAQEDKGFRLIALSAVAARAAPAIARWLGGHEDSTPITSTYRSTRQMLGKLVVTKRGRFNIEYDLMDGRTLEFEDERAEDRPYVPQPFEGVPSGIDATLGVEKKMRAPTLWAAIHLAAQRPDGTKPTVMISLTQSVSAWAETCADLIEEWAEEYDLPDYWSVAADDPHWLSCLAAAEDYFTRDSFEYRLLAQGIAVHHGQLPPLLARRLKVAIDRGNVRVVIATSTLSEGVNIPVNTLLIPSLHRSRDLFTLNEFNNLIGRAGRPGVATEGTAFVVLPEREYEGRGRRRKVAWNRTWDGYDALIGEIKKTTEVAARDLSVQEGEANSPLAILLMKLREAWEELSDSDDDANFIAWLENTAVVEDGSDGDSAGDENEDVSMALLDSLDGLLIAAIQEVEQLRGTTLGSADLEAELQSVWRRTYAHIAAGEEARLAQSWLARGRVVTNLYPDPDRRRQLYKASLPPRSGSILLDSANELRDALRAGSNYADLETDEKFEFVRDIIARLSDIPAFRVSTKLGKKRNPFTDWPTLLRWWLCKSTLRRQPKPKDLGPWFAFVSNNFIYRGNWGLGSLVGILLDRGDEFGPVDALTIDDWPRSGLPWIAFWLKELINWGTLDPVAAFLLARGNAIDRRQAETDAKQYYVALEKELTANDALDPRRIRTWVEGRRPSPVRRAPASNVMIVARLERPAGDYRVRKLSVMPLASTTGLSWIDPAGYTVARSDLPDGWSDQPKYYRFELSVDTRIVNGEVYLPHRSEGA